MLLLLHHHHEGGSRLAPHGPGAGYTRNMMRVWSWCCRWALVCRTKSIGLSEI
jgi:hypothetical protein